MTVNLAREARHFPRIMVATAAARVPPLEAGLVQKEGYTGANILLLTQGQMTREGVNDVLMQHLSVLPVARGRPNIRVARPRGTCPLGGGGPNGEVDVTMSPAVIAWMVV